MHYRGTILPLGTSYQSPCPICRQMVPVAGGRDLGGYRYGTHYRSLAERIETGRNCVNSGEYVAEEVLAGLIAIPA